MMNWKERIMEAAGGTMTGAVVACALGLEINPPCYNGMAAVTSDGFVMCDFTDAGGQRHMGAMIGALDDLVANVVQLARHIDMVASERAEFAEALVAWIGIEYCNAKSRLKSALTTAYPYQTPTLH